MKPSIPKGTRDFSPAEMQRRNYIFETIRNVFLLHGFQQIETPAMENLSVLEGKYGEEGDKLLFRILNSGPVFENLKSQISNLKLSDITEKGLRYDLTVPFARYVVQHRNEITFPFKRFQMQPVWRADRPQRGRYREFYQCDADIIGSDSLLNEAELIQIVDKVFSNLGIEVKIKVNNRKILNGLADFLKIQKLDEFINLLDEVERKGVDNVIMELTNKEILPISEQNRFRELFFQTINPDLDMSAIWNKLEILRGWLTSDIGNKGWEEINSLFRYFYGTLADLTQLELTNKLEFDIQLARGLNYYTGTIIEVKADGVQIGSVCGGGRYDDLTGIFGLPNVSGVGISFGVDRIYDVMEELKLFDALKTEQSSTQILFVNFGEKEELFCLKLVTELRNAGIAAELYPDRDKIKKQMSYANDRKIPFVALVGEEEMKSGKVKLKNMTSGDEKLVGKEQIADLIGKQ